MIPHYFAATSAFVRPGLDRLLRRCGRWAAWFGRLGAICGLVLGGALWGTVEPEFQVRNWQTQEGLPSSKINAVVQTRDGYLWIATYEGLVRFDGVRFTLFDNIKVPGWHDSGVTSLYEDPDGVLWIGHAGGAVSALRDGRFTTYPPHPDLRGGKIQSLGRDRAGDIWVLDSATHLVRLRDGLVLRPETGREPGLWEMACSKDGHIWVTIGGRLWELREAQVQAVPLLEAMDNNVHGLCTARDGGLWVAANGHLWKRSGETWSGDLGALATGNAPMHAFIETRDGRLVAGTSEFGALIIVPGAPQLGRQLQRATGFGANWVSSVFEDHEGGLWIGSGSTGLFRLHEKKVRMLVPADGWQGRAVLSAMPSREGDLWVGTEGAGLYRLRDGRWDNFASANGLRNQYVWSVQEDGEGGLWVGTWDGLQQWADGRFSIPVGTEAMHAPTPTTAILPARQGGLWVGSRLGLYRYREGEVLWAEPEPTRKLREVRALTEQADGTLWAGCNGDGLGRFRGGQVRQFRRQDGLSSDFIQCLHLEEDDTLWIGTRGGGLNRFKDGRFASVGVAQGLADNSICHIEDDGLGFLWLSSHGGIMRVSKAELNRCADGAGTGVTCLSYGLNDGLSTLACTGALQPAGGRMADGKLVFATDRGLAVLDPASVRLNPNAPPVVIERMREGDRVLAEAPFPAEPIEIGPGPRRLEIQYTALSFAAPEKVRFKRKLEGVDADWVPVGVERLAVFDYLPPGRYVFRIAAANNDNVWNEVGGSVAFVVRPHFWQTWWFRSLVVLAVLSATAGAVWVQARRRLQRRLERLEREHAIERERTRIANDMHDDLGAQLTRITMLSEMACGEIGGGGGARERVGQIYDTARNVTRAMDEIVWAVNPKHDRLESLLYYLEKCANDVVRPAGISCRLELPAELPAWQPRAEVRHHLFLAYKEALHNAVRHSRADTITIGWETNDDGCLLRVVDNGRGFDPARVPAAGSAEANRTAAGNGLPGMRERLARIGGRCTVETAPGQGCRVEFFVPGEAMGRPGKTR